MFSSFGIFLVGINSPKSADPVTNAPVSTGAPRNRAITIIANMSSMMANARRNPLAPFENFLEKKLKTASAKVMSVAIGIAQPF